jgi:hypothetical protein
LIRTPVQREREERERREADGRKRERETDARGPQWVVGIEEEYEGVRLREK